jgi:hypothetical protein
VTKTAADRPHQDGHEIEQPLRDAPDVHQPSGEEKEGDREQQEVVHLVEGRTRDHRRDARIEEISKQPGGPRERRDSCRKSDRHAERDQHDDRDERDQRDHHGVALRARRARVAMSARTNRIISATP